MLGRKRMELGDRKGENPGKSALPSFFSCHGSISVGFSSVHEISLSRFPYRKIRRIVPYNWLMMMMMMKLWVVYTKRVYMAGANQVKTKEGNLG